jgi:hypothetical protein
LEEIPMRLPKHATVVAYSALFVAMGGTAYAATGGTFVLGHANTAGHATTLKNTGAGAALSLQTAKTTTAALAVPNTTKIAHLNADRLDGLDSTVFAHNASVIRGTTSSAEGSVAAGTAGPWTFTLNCTGSSAGIVITGPGTVGGTTSVASGNSAGNIFVGAPAAINSGATSTIVAGAQLSQDRFLQSGSTTVEVRLFMTASNGGLFDDCAVIGSATSIA